VSFSHFGIGNALVRALTAHSRAFFQAPPPGFSAIAIAQLHPAMFVATDAMLPALSDLHSLMRSYAPGLRALDADQISGVVPVLKTGPGALVSGLLDAHALKLDSDALLQGYSRTARAAGAAIAAGCRVTAVTRRAGQWHVRCDNGDTLSATILVDAAGAWADRIALLAGLPPIGLTPLRRTAIIVDAPNGTDVRPWPFTKTVIDDFYMLPEGGRLVASPVDEIAAEPCDAQPEEIDLAIAAAKVEEYTTTPVRSIGRRWAGLRTFAPDRTPVIGPDPRLPGFFWMAGQGGFGLQTAPALAGAAAGLLLGEEWPQALAAAGVRAHDLAPERLIHGS
jgi:D-arginine dehydrogenase